MRTVNAIALSCLVALSCLTSQVWASEIQEERAAREECSAYPQAGMRECLSKKARESALALKQAEDKALAVLSKWDEDPQYIALAKGKFNASTKTFAQYREAQCAFAASLGGGAIGNALEMRRLACIFELNARRTEQLKSEVSSLPTK